MPAGDWPWSLNSDITKKGQTDKRKRNVQKNYQQYTHMQV